MNELRIGQCIRQFRRQHSITQAQLAQALQISYQTVSKWENDTTVPDVSMLPKIADYFGVTIDALFGRTGSSCSRAILEDDTRFLLNSYAQMYAPEAGPWNLSVRNKYLEYRFAQFFEEHFTVGNGDSICNIGIGAGAWDRYLAYQLKGGRLVSIDCLPVCCRQLEEGLRYEQNPHSVEVICADAMTLNLENQFEIVTMVGSTQRESGLGTALLEKALSFLKPGGSMYYQTINSEETMNDVFLAAQHTKTRIACHIEDSSHNFRCHYYKITRTA